MDLNVFLKPQGPEGRRTQPLNCQGSNHNKRQRSVHFPARMQETAEAGNSSQCMRRTGARRHPEHCPLLGSNSPAVETKSPILQMRKPSPVTVHSEGRHRICHMSSMAKSLCGKEDPIRCPKNCWWCQDLSLSAPPKSFVQSHGSRRLVKVGGGGGGLPEVSPQGCDREI